MRYYHGKIMFWVFGGKGFVIQKIYKKQHHKKNLKSGCVMLAPVNCNTSGRSVASDGIDCL